VGKDPGTKTEQTLMAPERENRPPKWANTLLEWYCSPRFIEEIQGDLQEAFYKRCKEQGRRTARFHFALDVLRSISFKTLDFQYPFSPTKNAMAMFRNYLIIGYRNIMGNKVFSLINIAGLAIGIAACFLIMQYVQFERSYDTFHTNADRIYRVTINSDRESSATNHPGAGPALKAEFPGVEDYARVVHQSIFMGNVAAWSYIDPQGNTTVFNEERVYNVDPSFLTIFSFPFVYGNPENALQDARSVVISQTVSRKFFGDENPLGRALLLNGDRPFTITGVFRDIPDNSHIKFDILVSYFLTQAWGGGWKHSWDWKWAEYYTYVLLKPKASRSTVEGGLQDLVKKYLGTQMEERNIDYQFHLQPIADIHLRSPDLSKEREVHGSERMVYFLVIIAVLILVIAWINYVNLSTSRSVQRAREVGMRKAIGASKQQLITQFLFESAMVNFLAIILAFIFVIAALPSFNQLTGKNINTGILDMLLSNPPSFWIILAGVFLFGSCCAGLYPAFVLSSYRVAAVLKGKFFGSRSGIALRKVLVGFQFVISVSLIAGTLMVFRQVSFMRNQELGYAKDQLLVVKSPLVADSTFRERLEAFKTEVKRNTNVNGMAPSSEIPGRMISQLNYVRNRDAGLEDNSLVYHLHIDKDFLNTYGLELAAGRNFRDDDRLNGNAEGENPPMPVMVNEKVLESLGYQNADEAVDQLVYFGLGERAWLGTIVGVVKNHHQRSLKDGYDPILFFPAPGFSGQYFTINLTINNPSETISYIEDQYERAFPGNAFEYFFLDGFFDRQYAADQQFGKVFGLFSGLAIIVACLGLFGLSTFMISQRTKEIAVRKVLGATISSMVYLFSRDFVKLTVLANVIALPLVYLAAQRWLSTFAFHTNIGWMTFLIPAVLLLIISVATVAVQTVKTGLADPVRSLRSE